MVFMPLGVPAVILGIKSHQCRPTAWRLVCACPAAMLCKAGTGCKPKATLVLPSRLNNR